MQPLKQISALLESTRLLRDVPFDDLPGGGGERREVEDELIVAGLIDLAVI
ncbi:hypothetical protein [Herbidospora daliensis]|uniref:hypothetical protein n=1 Tax=Herbidospora daliensis TaxID=295585 RepID=UPI000A8C813C|nr:hypothetical protein [Herbidospora daliensis]